MLRESGGIVDLNVWGVGHADTHTPHSSGIIQHFYPTYLLDLSLSLFFPFFPLPLSPSLQICAVVGGMAKKSRSVC